MDKFPGCDGNAERDQNARYSQSSWPITELERSKQKRAPGVSYFSAETVFSSRADERLPDFTVMRTLDFVNEIWLP